MPRNATSGTAGWVDPDDAPELDDAFWHRAEIRDGDVVVRRGRAPLDRPKQQVTVQLDADLIERMRASGPGWQTRMNEALRRWLDTA